MKAFPNSPCESTRIWVFKLVEGGGKKGFEDFGRGIKWISKGNGGMSVRPDLQSTNRGATENRLQINYQWGV